NFSVSGDITGAMGSGDKNTDFIWTNPDWTKPGFTIDKDGWEGTPAATNFISFQTHPAAYPMGFKKVTPALSDSITSELHRQEFMGESPT
ncbi:hypothetical protein KAR91_27105, partial [Candidatus Pacearchaeota archaeon]|nr:hypothetical protein [Candidatus Pacearchaeota archaeon]